MGWSCSDAANKVVLLWSARCVKDTGSSNVYRVGSTFFMFETSRREYDDGAITGSILRMLPNKPDGTVDPNADGRAVPAGTFRIDGDGTVKRGPAFLKKLAAEAAELTSSEAYARRFA